MCTQGCNVPRLTKGVTVKLFREGVWMEVGEQGSPTGTWGFVTGGTRGVATSHPTPCTALHEGPAQLGLLLFGRVLVPQWLLPPRRNTQVA